MRVITEENIDVNNGLWEPIEEFKRNPFNGWYWVHLNSGHVEMAYYDNSMFFYNDNCDIDRGEMFQGESVLHVIPIQEPEPP